MQIFKDRLRFLPLGDTRAGERKFSRFAKKIHAMVVRG
jgi:hypothetical protein